MVRLLWTSGLAVALLWLGNPAFSQEGIAWTTNLRTAQHVAARERKLILVHFYSDNCPPCRALERNVFPRPEVVAAIHLNYVPVKVHVDSAPQLAGRFRVESWPTDLILTAAGLEVTRMTSPRAAGDYVLMLDQIAFQSGVGAGRRGEHSQLTASRPEHDVALAAATTPMGQQSAATAVTSHGPAAGSTSPANATPYDPRAAGGTGTALPPTNPYAPQQPGQRYASAPAGSQQPAVAAAPNTAAFLQAARSGNGASTTAPMGASPAPSAARAPSNRSIYDDPPEQTYAPPPSIYAPQQPTAPPANGPVTPQTSIYGTPPSHPAPARQSSPQAPQQRTQMQQPAQQAGAQFRSPQFVEVSKAPPAAIDGFCPVTILESKRWHKGNVQFGAVHLGRTYLFASKQAQDKFLADPLRYAPVLSGCDPVIFAETNQFIDGNHNIGMLIGGKTYFFTSEDTRRRFELSPHVYIARAQQAISSAQRRSH